jgi:hypothetical protein
MWLRKVRRADRRVVCPVTRCNVTPSTSALTRSVSRPTLAFGGHEAGGPQPEQALPAELADPVVVPPQGLHPRIDERLEEVPTPPRRRRGG